MLYIADCSQINVLDSENVNVTLRELNIGIGKLQSWEYVNIISLDSLTCRVKTSDDGQMLYFEWRFGIVDILLELDKKT